MTKVNKLKINVLSYVSLSFNDPESTRERGGGWLRFQKILEMTKKEDVEFHLVAFKFLQAPAVLGVPRTIISMLKALFQTSKIVKTKNVHLILCPLEDPWIIIFGYLSSKITNRKFVVFLNSIPYFGLVNVSILAEDMRTSFSTLIENARAEGKSWLRSPFSAFLWHVNFRVLGSSSTKIVCLNSVLANELSKFGMKKNIVPIFPGNGVDFNAISSVPTGITKYNAIFAAGSLLPQKGVFDAIKIWAAVVKSQPIARLAIAGRVDSEHMHLIEEITCLISSLGLNQNVFLICDPKKGVPQNVLWKEMKGAKIFLYPSRKDMWPLVVGEALACGLSIVAYDLPGIRDAYADCPAVNLLKVGDLESAAKTIIDLLHDDSLLKNSSRKARQYAENHSWNSVIELERKAYLTILNC